MQAAAASKQTKIGFHAYSCSIAECNHHYTVADGHFRLVNGEKEIKSRKPCPECHAHQYLAKRGETTLDTIWLCPNKDCPSKRH
jgi:hypothetical protein